jgi:hypothetical protein
MTDFRLVHKLHAYSGGTVPVFHRISYSPFAHCQAQTALERLLFPCAPIISHIQGKVKRPPASYRWENAISCGACSKTHRILETGNCAQKMSFEVGEGLFSLSDSEANASADLRKVPIYKGFQTKMKRTGNRQHCINYRFSFGQAVNNALEQAHFKNVAKSMFSGRKRTGFS